MEAHRISVLKTARYFTLGLPGKHIREIWFVCHGYRQLAKNFLSKFAGLDDGKTLVVAPEGYHRFYVEGYAGKVGASWMTSEDREADIADYIGYLNHLYDRVTAGCNLDAASVNVLGFSQGTATVGRWCVSGTKKIDRLVLWAGRFPTDVDAPAVERHLANVPVDFVVGTQDAFISEDDIRAHSSWLAAQPFTHSLTTFQGGHVVEEATLLEVAGR